MLCGINVQSENKLEKVWALRPAADNTMSVTTACSVRYRGTLLTTNSTPPQDYHMTLGTVLLLGIRILFLLVSEVPLYPVNVQSENKMEKDFVELVSRTRELEAQNKLSHAAACLCGASLPSSARAEREQDGTVLGPLRPTRGNTIGITTPFFSLFFQSVTL